VKRGIIAIVVFMTLLGFASQVLCQEQQQQTFGSKFKSFWKKLFNYPANFTEETVDVIAGTGKRATGVVTTEVKRVGEVSSGELSKSKELVLEPLENAAETVKYAAEGIVKTPVKAAQDEKPAE